MANIAVSATKVRPLVPSWVATGVAGEALQHGQVVRRNSNGAWIKAQADNATNASGLLGIVVAGGDSSGNVASGKVISVLLWGRISGFSSLSPTAKYYLSDTAGAISDTAGTVSRILGYADADSVAASEALFFAPEHI